MSNEPSSAKPWPPCSSSALQDTSSSQTPSPDFGTMQRQPYYRTQSHSSATSERRAQRNRARDPSWVPRPPNAFIIFRAEYSRKHAQANKDSSVKTPEKTLSKRAAETWRVLSESEKARYKQLAEQERLDHAKKHPDYRYKPQRRQGDVPRVTVSISRREQVESFVRRRTAMRSKSRSSESESASDCTSPPSPASVDYSSSSPEPLNTPFRDNSPATCMWSEGRSSSLPSRLSAPLYHHSEHSLLLSGCSGASDFPQFSSDSFDDEKPGLYTDASSHYGDPFPWPIQPLDAGFNLWPSTQGAGLAQSPSASPVRSALSAFSFGSSDMSGVATPPDLYPPATASNVASSVSVATSPLLQRRKAATTSGTFPSPLSVVSSSLAQWNNAPVPTVAITGASPTTERPPTPPTPPTPPMPPQAYVHPESRQPTDVRTWPPETFCSGPAQAGRVDYDRTPRASNFPATVHAQFLLRGTGMAGSPLDAVGDVYPWQGMRHFNIPAGTYYNVQADFQSYAMGLREMGIESYGTPYPPDIDINEFVNFDGDVAT